MFFAKPSSLDTFQHRDAITEASIFVADLAAMLFDLGRTFEKAAWLEYFLRLVIGERRRYLFCQRPANNSCFPAVFAEEVSRLSVGLADQEAQNRRSSNDAAIVGFEPSSKMPGRFSNFADDPNKPAQSGCLSHLGGLVVDDCFLEQYRRGNMKNDDALGLHKTGNRYRPLLFQIAECPFDHD